MFPLASGAQDPSSNFSQPTLWALGFGDISYVSRDSSEQDGFVIGQAVAHVIADLGDDDSSD